jgi:hypothetical protein
MNGARGEPAAKMNNKPNKTNMTIMGIIHQSFRCQRKLSNSPNVPDLDIKFFHMLIFVSF